MFGAAVLLCDRFCTCEVNAAPKSSLKPVNSAPGSLVVSNTLMPRLSCGRKYCIVIGRPFFQDDSRRPLRPPLSSAVLAGVAFGTGGGRRWR